MSPEIKYERHGDGDRAEHIWSAHDDRGGVHIWARLSKLEGWPAEWLGGCEHHSPTPLYGSDDKPHHQECWLLGGPCWHDGTSLYFRENIAHFLPYPDSADPHDMTHAHSAVEHYVRSLWRSWIEEPAA